MGKVYTVINQQLRDFIQRQEMFFVATAPLASDGLLNLSPQGHDSFRILDETTVMYADLTGSGVETIAHLKQNGRIVVMFCGFEGAPKIVRLHGRGDVIEQDHAEYSTLSSEFGQLGPLRSVIRIDCQRISDSCGFGVPVYEYQSPRTQLLDWNAKKGFEGVREYQREMNGRSLDGLVGLDMDD